MENMIQSCKTWIKEREYVLSKFLKLEQRINYTKISEITTEMKICIVDLWLTALTVKTELTELKWNVSGVLRCVIWIKTIVNSIIAFLSPKLTAKNSTHEFLEDRRSIRPLKHNFYLKMWVKLARFENASRRLR